MKIMIIVECNSKPAHSNLLLKLQKWMGRWSSAWIVKWEHIE